jgi:glyoxylase-like metal-dependent hydrolase (beta-lactamase superfamily II)
MNEKKIHCITVGTFATNCWIYPLEKDSATGIPCAVIDPGEEGSRIIAFLEKLRLFPAFIVLTHGHFDHIGAVPALAAKYGKGGKKPEIAIHAADAEYLGPDTTPDKMLAERDCIGPFTVLHLPGHTPGSIGLWDKEEGVLFSGDTLFCGDYGRTDLPGGNREQIFTSLKRLLAMDVNIKVFPGHDETTTIGRETRSNDFVTRRW